jgi:peptide/nickel transport system substrate-binding protein
MKHDIDRARQLVKEAGQDGRPVVVLNPTDRPHISRAAVVTQRRFESVGFKVDLRDTDWSTLLEIRASKAPPDKGGWNILHTWFTGADVISPAVHFGISGAGPNAWFGWPDVPQIEKLTLDWVRATDPTKRKQLAEDIQRIALSEVTYGPWGEWDQPTAFRKNVQGILPFTAPLFWNVAVR